MALDVGLAVRLCDPDQTPLMARPTEPDRLPGSTCVPWCCELTWRDGRRWKSCQEVATHVRVGILPTDSQAGALKNGKTSLMIKSAAITQFRAYCVPCYHNILSTCYFFLFFTTAL